MRPGHALTATGAPDWRPALAAAGWALVILGFGGAATDLGPWYQSLQQPAWKPPRAAFGPAWTVILGLAAVAAFIAWRKAAAPGQRAWIVGLFLLNGVLNVLWSVLFFILRRPDWALFELAVLWLSILVLVVVGGRLSRAAGWCLLPYLLWVAYAGAINLAVVDLNGPFGGV